LKIRTERRKSRRKNENKGDPKNHPPIKKEAEPWLILTLTRIHALNVRKTIKKQGGKMAGFDI
jgi:hypothetical protein